MAHISERRLYRRITIQKRGAEVKRGKNVDGQRSKSDGRSEKYKKYKRGQLST